MEPSQPYIPLSIEELSLVHSLEHWTNLKVRIFGLICSRNLEQSSVVLKGLGEEREAHIKVDYR